MHDSISPNFELPVIICFYLFEVFFMFSPDNPSIPFSPVFLHLKLL